MIEFFSYHRHNKEQVAGRAIITAAALFFLLIAIIHSLPSGEAWAERLEAFGLSGYQKAEETTAPSLSDAELEEFYDYPIAKPRNDPSALAASLHSSARGTSDFAR